MRRIETEDPDGSFLQTFTYWVHATEFNYFVRTDKPWGDLTQAVRKMILDDVWIHRDTTERNTYA